MVIHVAVAAIEVAPARYLAKKGIKARHVLPPQKKRAPRRARFSKIDASSLPILGFGMRMVCFIKTVGKAFLGLALLYPED